MTFSRASAVEADCAGLYRARLHPEWSVGSRLHGGYLLATTVRAAVLHCGQDTPDPVAVSAQYFRPPVPGPALVRAETLKKGSTVSVARAALEQDGALVLEATVNCGLLPDTDPLWAQEVPAPAAPPDDAVNVAATRAGSKLELTRACEVWLDPATGAFLSTSRGEPRLRLWTRLREEQPDLLFALLAGDIAMPTTFNLGMFGWAPTVQLTALLRCHPAPGWLSVGVVTHSVHGQWFDEDATVSDSTGRIVCQTRQLALVPR